MSGLRQSPRVLNNLGSLHIVTGTITVNSDVWTLVTNDATCTLTDIGPGNARADFGEAFTTAPRVNATILKATNENQVMKNVLIESISAGAVEFVHHSFDDTGAGETDITTVDPDDDDGWMSVAIGRRNK